MKKILLLHIRKVREAVHSGGKHVRQPYARAGARDQEAGTLGLRPIFVASCQTVSRVELQ